VTAASESGDDQLEIEEVVVAETRLAGDVFGVGESVAVDAEALSRIQPVDAEQLFQALPGFSVSRPGGPGGVSEIFLRGAESNFTAVYIDGIRLNDSSNTRGGSFDFSTLGIYDVDRIDVATGAMSAIYGADAMAGVIQVRSAWQEPGSLGVFLEAGSVEDWRAGAGTSISIDDELQLGVRVSASDGGNEIEGSSLRQKSAAARLAGSWPNNGTWDVNVRHNQRDRSSFPEVSGGPELAVNRELEFADGDELSIGVTSDWALTDSWVTGLTLSATRIRDSVAVPAVPAGVLDEQPAFTTITRYERRQLLWINRVELAAGSHLVAGVDLVSEDGSDQGSVDLGFAVVPNSYELIRSQSSAFAELGKQWTNGFTATVATRWDHDGEDGRLSGKLGISKNIIGNSGRIWARIANGFKLPSFFALGNPLFGNPDLIVEKVRSEEIGYTHTFDSDGELIVSAFKSRYDDLVDFDFESFTNVNKGRIDVSGMEVRVNLDLSPNLRMLLDGTWSNISSESGPLRRRPERMAGASMDWSPAQQWQVNLTARYLGPRLITSIPTGDVDAPGFTVVAATVSYEPLPNRSFWIAINNALDENYQDAPGFPSPGARLRIGARMIF